MSRVAHFSVTTLADAAGGERLPSLPVTLAYVRACGGDLAVWEARWRSAAAEVSAGSAAEVSDGNGGLCPYVGLVAFQSGDADRFFGRDRVVAELAERVAEHRFVGVFGASGSGKSSVLRAGLAAKVMTDGLSGDGGGAPTMVFTPGPHPMEECAVALAGLSGESVAVLRAELTASADALHLRVRQTLTAHPGQTDLLLIVDQFEELFTLCQDTAERAAFITALLRAADPQTGRTRVVLGVRADFYGHCGQYAELAEALNTAQFLIGPMTSEELTQAITRPARHAGCTVDTALVARLVSDATGQPSALPLVSHALVETWRRRHGTRLTLAGYEAAGGIHHAIAHTAEHVYNRLSPTEQHAARQIFLRLTALADTPEPTRRRATRRELDTTNPDIAPVLETLTGSRLLTLDHDSVELAHEALIRYWPRLREWLNQDRDGLRLHRELGERARAWDRHDRDPGSLYAGVELELARRWAANHPDHLDHLERDFYHASLAAEHVQHTATRTRQRSRRRQLRILSGLLVLALAAGLLARQQRNHAVQQQRVALAQRIAVQAEVLRATNPNLAAQLALAAYRLAPNNQTRTGLLNAVNAPYRTRFASAVGPAYSVVLSPDGHTIAVAGESGIWLSDLADPRQLPRLAVIPSNRYSAAVFSPDGHTLATSVSTQTGRGSVFTTRLWDITDTRHPSELSTLPTGGTDWVDSAAFDPDSHILATAQITDPDNAGAGAGSIRLWDITDVRHPRPLPPLPGRHASCRSVTISPAGHTLTATCPDEPIQRWDLTDPRHPHQLAPLTTGPAAPSAVSPDGRTIAIATSEHSIRLLDLTDPGHPRQLPPPSGDIDEVRYLVFSPDSRTLATTSDEETIQLWDFADPHRGPQLIATLPEQTGGADQVAFSSDGHTLIATQASQDVIERIDLPLIGHAPAAIATVTFSPDGHTIATTSPDGPPQLWDHTPDHLRQLTTLNPATTSGAAVAFSPDGRTLATMNQRGTRLWDLTQAHQPRELPAPTTQHPQAMAFSPDSHTLAVASRDDRTDEYAIRVWDTTKSYPTQNPPLLRQRDYSEPLTLTFSPDGNILASADAIQVGPIWDISDRHHPHQMTPIMTLNANRTTRTTRAMAFSPDGRLLAIDSAILDYTDPEHPRQIATLNQTSDALSLAFSPDNHTLATTGDDHTTHLWDLTDPAHPIELATLNQPDTPTSVAFSPDGHTIATGSTDHTLRIWDTNIPHLIDHLCNLAHTPITHTEWDRYLQELNYQPPCP